MASGQNLIYRGPPRFVSDQQKMGKKDKKEDEAEVEDDEFEEGILCA